MACLLIYGLTFIFHWKAQRVIVFRSAFMVCWHIPTSLTLAKSDESSANNFIVEDMLAVKSLMYTKNKRGPRTEPWGTPELSGNEVRNGSIQHSSLISITQEVF